MIKNQARARAHTNIALIKYWGKRDAHFILPFNSSISLTLEPFYTDTEVCFDHELLEDEFYLDGTRQKPEATVKVHHFLNLVREHASISSPAKIISNNHVPNSAGLASSASAFAALAAAASRAAGLHLNPTELSRLARRGSGSATRSIFGGFVKWEKGSSETTSEAISLQENVDWDIQMIAILINPAKKRISSRNGMAATVATSPYFPAWVKTAEQAIPEMTAAILKKNIKLVGQLAQTNALQMHATTLAAVPGFTYFEPQTLQTIALIEQLQSEGISCYYTMDAGPNVKVICTAAETPFILRRLETVFRPEQLLIAKPGPGVMYYDKGWKGSDEF